MKVQKRRILLLCPYPMGVAPGQRLKYEQYLDFLEREGYEITVSPFLSHATWKILYLRGNLLRKVGGVAMGYLRRCRDLLRLPFFDGAYVFLHVTPFGGSLFERLCRRFAKRMIYDIDDLVFLGKTSPQNRIAGLLRTPKKYHYLMEKSDHVITCTPYLDSYVRKFNEHTTDISSTIRTDAYLPVNAYANDRILTIGWSGSHSTVPYLNLLESVFRKLASRHKFKLRVVGSNTFKLEGIEVEALPWVESSEVEDLQGIDIGVYPLPKEEWVLGKSGLKALQYMALGIPTVATAIGANFRVIEHGISGFLVNSEEEWLATLEMLLLDPALRGRIGGAARARVDSIFSVKANEPQYLSVFQNVFMPEARS